ncbi:MAG: response regulator transcription factor [Ruminococcus sp.]|nr:response regulator transcription factor [Ruminococcus sp.]
METEYILIVDDDSDIRNLIGIYLESDGFKYIKCDNAVTALEVVEKTKVSLILLDVMMPGMDGISACMKLREKTNAPIIFISAKAEDLDIVNGLMSGADDYVTKPFSPVQLMTRVKAQLRRYKQYSASREESHTLEYEDLTLDTETHRVWVNGVLKELTFKEYGILELLMRNKGITLSIKQIYESVWNEEFYASENTVMMHIANLRRKLNSDGRDYIKTVWGRGYRI